MTPPTISMNTNNKTFNLNFNLNVNEQKQNKSETEQVSIEQILKKRTPKQEENDVYGIKNIV